VPIRKDPLITGGYYHIYNRGIDDRNIFTHKREWNRALLSLWYYRFHQPQHKLSHYLSLGQDQQLTAIQRLKAQPTIIQVIAYCLMDNHFHLLLQQTQETGISTYLSNFQNSYSKYFNLRHERTGPIFPSPFKSVLIHSDEQLLHIARYIHLNPYTSYKIKTIEEIFTYPYSSAIEYFGNAYNHRITTPNILDTYFPKLQQHHDFIRDQSNYQRQINNIRHLTFE
jgi:putative transposase